MASPKAAQASTPPKAAMRTQFDYESCASRLKALADSDRLRIVNQLLRGEVSVSRLADELGEPIDKISHHLGVLRAAQLVRTRKQGKFVVYSLASDIAAAGIDDGPLKTIDLGCCQLEIVQPALPKARRRARKKA